MKKLLYILPLTLSACLKDTSSTVNFGTVKPVIEQLNSANYLNQTTAGQANLYSYFMQLRVDSTYLASDSVVVDVGGPLIGKDVTVTLGVDTGAFDAFNNANGGGFALLPAGTYAWTNGNTATIKAGKGTAACYLTFHTDQIDFTQPYILPVSITDAQGQTISGNYGKTMYAIIPGNQYMGLYQSVGNRVMGENVYIINDLKQVYDLSAFFVVQGGYPTAPNPNPHGPYVSALIPNAVVANCADQTVYLSIGEQMDLTVDPAGGVTVTNDNIYGFGKQTYKLISGSSTWDPVKHAFTLSYGFIDPYSGDTSVVQETMTRLR
ncbi:DUF1735 domain-containing protein [Dinghuibacter silviterrae]|uniref:Uncharacterized protein DUF1735 n=1 Tax=Dinghuibacter silviterrae TaxID=1539049 RepID=A0A4V3GKH7_9BACT|nr:DUF1735 domain-containing protein [Dinghuibacter silviterrae]TDW95722.1 uncharacterized protein DUF1735 [Dinghuibacter silviterrae]